MSIKANELRIGNLVYYGESIRVITQIGVSPQRNFVGVDNMITTFDVISPIPLTPEILEKAGFVKHDGMYLKIFKSINSQNTFCINEIGQAVEESGRVVFKERFGFCYTLEYSHIAVESEYIVYVDSLHQLQNLYFALTGEELIVKF